MPKSTTQSVLLPSVFQKPVVATFDIANQTSDAGALLLGAIDRRIGLTRAVSTHLVDRRQASKVEHELHALLNQRVFSIAAGYPDGNDARALRNDPALKMLCDRDPESEDALASQPTLSRFENSVTPRDVVNACRAFETHRIQALAERHPDARRVVIDLDGTADSTHGQQYFSYFNAFYDTHCFIPLLGFLSVDGMPEQHLFSVRLRPGIGSARQGVVPLLRRVVKQVRQSLPKARILVRLDGGFVSSPLLDILDELRVEYLLGLPSNSVLHRRSKRLLRGLRSKVRKAGVASRRYGSVSYRAKKWKRDRRVVAKAEVLPPPTSAPNRATKVNMRYVVTNLKSTAKHVYEVVYCARGDSENRIKELKNDLAMDRTSCSSFVANQLRVLMTATAYVLFQELRDQLPASETARAQVHTLRIRFVKVAAQIVQSTRRIVLHLPESCPSKAEWCAVARRLALSGSG